MNFKLVLLSIFIIILPMLFYIIKEAMESHKNFKIVIQKYQLIYKKIIPFK